jgi:hypothetical protein
VQLATLFLREVPLRPMPSMRRSKAKAAAEPAPQTA